METYHNRLAESSPDVPGRAASTVSSVLTTETQTPVIRFWLRSYLSQSNVKGVLADVSISASMVWYLRKGRTGLRKSDDMIGHLIMLTIATGSLTTLCVIANLIAYLAGPEQLYVLFFNVVLGKLYINSVSTSLNSRTYVRGGNSATVQINSIPLSTFQARQAHNSQSNLDSTAAASSEEVGKENIVGLVRLQPYT